MTGALWRLSIGLLTVLLTATAARAQIVVEAAGATRPTRILAEVIERDRYTLLDRDTVIPAGTQLSGDLVIRDAQVRLEGSIEGTVVVLGGALYVRPGARVGGPIAVVRGLALGSQLAQTGPIVEMPPGREARITVTEETVRVRALPPPRVAHIGLPGAFGFRDTRYDRVAGLTLTWGPQLRLRAEEFGPTLDAWASYQTARREFGGGAELRVPWTHVELATGAARATLTNEWWIRGPLANSAETLLFGRDVRDYYEADRAWLRLQRRLASPRLTGEVAVLPFAGISVSRNRSLSGRRVWALSGRSELERPNRAVADSTIVSAELGAGLEWDGRSSAFRAHTSLETARSEWGDLGFTRWLVDGRWRMDGLWNHALEVHGHAFGTVGDDAAPPQRWSHLGGVGTLPTLPLAARAGDRLVLLHSAYRIPIAPLDLPFAGPPTLELLHSVGTAWTTGERMPSWDQNLGVGLDLTAVRGRAWIDPSIARPRATFLVELSLPRGRAPPL